MNDAVEAPGRKATTGSRRWFLRHATALGASGLPLARLVAGERPPVFVESHCNIVKLPCDRRLAYAEYGDPAGQRTVLLFHGVPSCRLEAQVFVATLRAYPGVRLIALDRPGFGRSDSDHAGSFLAWPADAAAVADALHVERFSLLASSGGTPFALAVARAFPERVTAVSLACPIAPLEAVDTAGSSGARGILLCQQHPRLATAALNRFVNGLRRHPDRIPFSRFMDPAERAHLANPAAHQLYVQVTLEAFCQGPAEVARAAAQLAQPWACWLNQVRTKVSIFQGCRDEITPPNMARYLAATLPNAELTLIEGEGHMSLSWYHAANLLGAALAGK